MKKHKKLLLLDSNYVLHRVCHVPALAALKTSKGQRTGGVYGFLNTIVSVSDLFPGYVTYACWDKGLCEQRKMIFPDYKANRYETRPVESLSPQEQASYYEKQEYLDYFREQRQLVEETLELLGIPSLSVQGWEGDDLLALLSKGDAKTVILSDDKDMIQLVSEQCRIYRPIASQKEASPVIIDMKWLTDNGYKDAEDYMIQKSIKGDPSDNIPDSAPGVGAKKIADFMILQEGLREIWSSSSEGLQSIDAQDKVRNLCEDKGVKYYSAYLKYKPDIFSVNKKIIDLNNIPHLYTEQQIQEVYREVDLSYKNAKEKRDFFGSIRKFKELEFNTSPDSKRRSLNPEMFTRF